MDPSNGTNRTSDSSDTSDFQRFNSVASVVIPVVFGTITAVGIVGNTIVIITILFNRKRRVGGRNPGQSSGPPTSTTDILIANLALADLLFVVFCVPFSAVRFVVTAWPFGLFICQIYQYGIYVNAYASVYTLVLMSADRYLAVVHPIKSLGWRSPRNACLASFLVWIVALLSNAALVGEIKVLDGFSGNETFCDVAKFYDEEDGRRFMRLFYGSFFIFGFLLPLTLTMILYGVLLRKLLFEGMAAKHRSRTLNKSSNNGRKLSKAMAGEESVHPGNASNLEIKASNDKRPSAVVTRKPASLKRSKKRQRVTQMVVIVVVTFASCWLPIQIIFVVHSFGRYPENVPALAFKLACNCLAYMNSCLNPILYAFFSQHFRKGFKNLLCACFCCCCCSCPASLGNRDGRARRASTRNEKESQKGTPRDAHSKMDHVIHADENKLEKNL